MTQRTELHDFIDRIPSTLVSLKNGTLKPDIIKFVLCNESCDLDSTACSITYAFFLDKTKSNNSTVVFPVLNTSRKEFPLRSDIIALLSHYEVASESLIFAEDISFLRESNNNLLFERLQVVLVDHNYPCHNDLWLLEKVVKVIDHHEILSHELPMKNCTELLVERVGSCSTIVAEEMLKFEVPSDENAEKSVYQIDSTSSAFLLGAILVDTVCGSPAAGRQTPKDAEILGKLDETAHLPYNHGRFFDWLMNAKFDISRLSTSDLLRKDAKLVAVGQTRIMMCSIPASFSCLFSRPDLGDSLNQVLISSSSCAVVVLCLSYTNPVVPDDAKRELGIFSNDYELLVSLASWLQLSKNVDLKLTQFNVESSENGRVELFAGNSHDDSGTTSPVFVNLILGDRMIIFSQGNTRASRKQVLPLVEDFVKFRNANIGDKKL